MVGLELDERYRVLRKLGEGGWGEVYLAEHVALGRKEALKILHAKLGETEAMVSRFRREARATNRLQHPNVVGVYDFGKLPDGRFYLTTEYVEGEPLDLLLERLGRFPVARALWILAQLADAVDHAHARGVIHRDLKPQNLILLEDHDIPDFLKVLDFGIAKIVDPDYRETVQPTREGEVVGSPGYMAPELAQGEGDEPRSDIYSVGCMAVELLTGLLPFSGSLMDVLRAHASRPPEAPSARNETVPPELDAVVLRCLEKDPGDRFQSGAELAAALRDVPGFPRERTPVGWRIYRAAGLSEETTETAAADPGLASTEVASVVADADPDVEEAGRRLRASIRDLAEALADAGVRDVSIVVGLADVRSLERELEEMDREVAALESQAEAAEWRARELEASIRFALGELRFDRDQARETGEPAPPDIEGQIEALERRLVEVTREAEREKAELTERAAALAERRASRRETMERLYASLERLVAETAARFSEEPGIEQLAAKWQESRVAFNRARARR